MLSRRAFSLDTFYLVRPPPPPLPPRANGSSDWRRDLLLHRGPFPPPSRDLASFFFNHLSRLQNATARRVPLFLSLLRDFSPFRGALFLLKGEGLQESSSFPCASWKNSCLPPPFSSGGVPLYANLADFVETPPPPPLFPQGGPVSPFLRPPPPFCVEGN